MIFIRTDANEKIATGHMMRCITIAKELMMRKQKVRFLVSDQASVILLIKNDFDYVILDTKWNCMNSPKEIEKTKFILKTSYEKENIIPILFVDSYFVSNDYFKQLKPFAKLVMFDDLHRDIYDVDLLINYNVAYNQFNYKKSYINSATHLLLGSRYTPLRVQFLEYINKQKTVYNKLCELAKQATLNTQRQILLICGGGDPLNVLTQMLDRASRKEDFENYYFHVVVGAYNSNIKELELFERRFLNINLCYNVVNMAELMSNCDIAISSASTVLYECCSMGIPTIFFVMADNQEDDGYAFAKDEYMVYAGDVRKNSIETIDFAFEALHKLSNDFDLQIKMSKHMQKIVDGRGTERIVNLFCQIFEID